MLDAWMGGRVGEWMGSWKVGKARVSQDELVVRSSLVGGISGLGGVSEWVDGRYEAQRDGLSNGFSRWTLLCGAYGEDGTERGREGGSWH